MDNFKREERQGARAYIQKKFYWQRFVLGWIFYLFALLLYTEASYFVALLVFTIATFVLKSCYTILMTVSDSNNNDQVIELSIFERKRAQNMIETINNKDKSQINKIKKSID